MSSKTKKQKAAKFDPVSIRAEKLAWVRKAVSDVRQCATYYGMDQSELDWLAVFLATGGAGITGSMAVSAFDAIREMAAEALAGAGRVEPSKLEQPVDPEITAMLRAELDKAGAA